jgi:hypothetical protein
MKKWRFDSKKTVIFSKNGMANTAKNGDHNIVPHEPILRLKNLQPHRWHPEKMRKLSVAELSNFHKLSQDKNQTLVENSPNLVTLNFKSPYNTPISIKVTSPIGDLGSFFENHRIIPHCCATLFPDYRLCRIFDKNRLCYILGDFFTNSFCAKSTFQDTMKHTAIRLRSQRPLHVQGDASHPG